MGIKKNILYTSVLTTSNYLFPLIIYPYVSRVLGVENIGLCNFIDSVINYFILISMMGVNIMGTRQIAIDKAQDQSLNKAFSSLLWLTFITTAIAFILLIILTYSIKELNENKDLMWYGAIKLVSNFLLIEWFYKGIEEFKFITIRTLIVKIIYIVFIFLLVKERKDYSIYYLLSVLMITANAIINISYSRHFASFVVRLVSIKPYIKSFIILGGYFFLTSLYTTFNIVYLGFVSNDTQVGYYTTAAKLYSILLSLFSGVSTVIMPRMSNLLAQNKIEEFKSLLSKTTDYLFTFGIPLVIFTTILAPNIIYLISGPGYEGATTPMRIIMPLMIIIGYEQIQVIQCLMPLRKDKNIIINSGVGAVVGILLNLLLVKHLLAVGSAITWFIAELSILVLSQIIMKRELNVNFPSKVFSKAVGSNLPLIFILILIYLPLRNYENVIVLGVCLVVTIIYFISVQLFILKNPILEHYLFVVKNKFKRY
ncbi:MAG: oligosaccharide flippase family protein [Muribaculaceae bacterium]|nr:oligosaccharide flippase family protein [Muribaculaceae bacterium]